jgi:hypothetical protein
VLYRTPDPDGMTVAEVEMILQQKGIEVTQLMKWTANFTYLHANIRQT